MAAAPSTYIWIPSSLVRITNDAREEVGGVLVFKKIVDETGTQKILRLERCELMAGGAIGVDPTDLLHSRVNDPQIVTFHTHPVVDAPQYMGLSYSDMDMILQCNLTRPGDAPTVYHILFTPHYVHFTLLVPNVYKMIRKMFEIYIQERKAAQPGVTDDVLLTEFIRGMRFIFYFAELFLLEQGPDDIRGMSIVDSIWFTPDDWVTYYIMEYVKSKRAIEPSPEALTFYNWFIGKRPAFMTAQRDEAPAKAKADADALLAGDKTKAGLFYSYSITKEAFLSTGTNGIMLLSDGGYVFDNYNQAPVQKFDLNRVMLDALYKSPPVRGGSKVVDKVNFEELKSIDEVAKKDLMKGGVLVKDVNLSSLKSVDTAAKSDVDEDEIMKGGKKRRTYRKKRRGAKKTIKFLS